MRHLTVIILVALAAATAFAQDARTKLVEAIYEETVSGDLTRAVSLYREVIADGEDESLAARATLRLGNCLRKQGDTESARKAYRKVVDEFSTQTEVVKQAKLELLSLGPGEDELKEWSQRLKEEISLLREALGKVNESIETIKQEVAEARTREKAIEAFTGMVIREETRTDVKAYLASHYFRSGLSAYRALDYEIALEDFRAAAGLAPGDGLVRGYLEKTEFILGDRPTLTPGAMNSAPDDPAAIISEEIKAAYEIAASSAEEGNYRLALAALEEIFARLRWTDSLLMTEDSKKLLKKADDLAEECLIRLYPAESRNLKILSAERRELAGKLKEKLGEILASRHDKRAAVEAAHQKARELADAGNLPEAKRLVEEMIATGNETPEIRELLNSINRAILEGVSETREKASYEILATVFALPAGELDSLKLPFETLKPTNKESVPLVYAVMGQKKGRDVLSLAALSGKNTLARFSEMKVASGEETSGFLGSSMSYISGYRKNSDSADGDFEPVKDIVFQGIKLRLNPVARKDKTSLLVDATVSVVEGEPRVVQTKEGQIEIPRLYQVSLEHTFELEDGRYLVVGSFPNTISPGTGIEKDDMYLVLFPKKVVEDKETGNDK